MGPVTFAAAGPLVLLAVLLAVAPRYGYHRDELYFLVAGAHPALGYPDQPPLVPLLDRAVAWLVPGSVAALRVPPALAAATVPVLAGLTARELGARPWARVLAVWCMSAAVVLYGAGHLAGTTAFDLLVWSAVVWLVARALRTGDSRLWVAVGAAAGVGLEVKWLVGFLLGTLGVALLADRRWGLLRDPWLWAGAALALALWAPNLWWQATHGWPQVEMSRRIGERYGTGERLLVPLAQLVMVSPFLVPVWVAGLRRLLRDPALRAFRAIGVAYLLLLVLFTVTGGQIYYVAGLYPALLAAGAEPLLAWVRGGRARWFGGSLVASVALAVVVTLPVLPPRVLARTPIPGVTYDLGEQVAWPRYVATVAAVYGALPAEQRSRAVLLTANYGEAGAIDRFGDRFGLPRAYSGHNGYGTWGPPPDGRDVVVAVGLARPWLTPYFTGCAVRARLDNGVGLDSDEQGAPVTVCRGLRAPWSQLWPRLRHLG